jgi:type II secretory pathway component PulK
LVGESAKGAIASRALATCSEARDAQGGFSSLDELEAVRGIGPALMAKLRPLVAVGAGAAIGGAAKGAAKPAAPNATK